MKKSVKTLEIMAKFSMKNELEKLVKSGMSKDDALKNVNERVKLVASNKLINNNIVDFNQLVDGVQYEQITETGEPIFRMLKVNDLYILKANKHSKKIVLNGDIVTLLECFGCNLLSAKLDEIGDDTLLKLKVYTKYQPALECFTCETSTSINQLEKQLDSIFVALLGEENAPKVKKSIVRHIKEQYTIANADGYKNGNILTLLQLIVNHAFDARYDVQYVVKSGLNSHKEIKSKKKDVEKVTATITQKA